MKGKKISGKVVYEQLEGGFWGIRDGEGNQWQIVNMPEQLKHPGKQVRVVIRPLDLMSMAMWGTPARIVSFHT